jgi:hypothetical protein
VAKKILNCFPKFEKKISKKREYFERTISFNFNFLHFGKNSHQKNTASWGSVIDGVILRKLLIG